MFYLINQIAVLTMLAIASYEDIKTREVRLITQAWLFFQSVLWIVWLLVITPHIAIRSLFVGFIILGWSYFLYKNVGLGGADGKIMVCLALVKPQFAYVLGAIVMLCATGILLLKRYKVIKQSNIVPLVPVISLCYIVLLIM